MGGRHGQLSDGIVLDTFCGTGTSILRVNMHAIDEPENSFEIFNITLSIGTLS
jgi:hypothetical protein